MGGFAGKVAFVTGAGSGIGRATALLLGRGEARVAVADIDAAAAEATAAAVRTEGGDALAVHVDVTDEISVKSGIAAAVEAYGGLQVLANVAGTGCFRHTTEASLDDWNRILAVNLTGVFLVCREALPVLLDRGGAIVNVASIAGVKAHPYAAAYCASKGGVVALSRSLAIEYARRGVRVNAVCPSGVFTPLLEHFTAPDDADPVLFARILPPTDQMSQPEEVAAAIAFLASDAAVNITGTELLVDGGVSA